MGTNSSGSPIWTREEDKILENGIAIYGNDIDRWIYIAVLMIPGKSIQEIKEHYENLVDDLNDIDAGVVPIPDYGGEKRKAKSIADRRRGFPWTEKEHSLFLQGLDKLGRGDWRGIARHFVLTRTPSQVASHAQKFYERMKPSKSRRRNSIHDVTTVDEGSKSGPIEGESSQFPIDVDNIGEFHAQMTDVGMDYCNTSTQQGIIHTPWMSDTGMHDDKHTNFLSTGLELLENLPNVTERIGIGGDRTLTSDQLAQRYRVGGGVGFGSDMPVQQMPSNSISPIDTIDDFGSLIPSTDVDTFRFLSNFYTSQ